MHEYGIVVVFVALVVIAVGSSAYFRRRSLSTGQRAVLSVVAVVLLLLGLARDGGHSVGRLQLAVFAAVVFGVAVYYLWRAQKHPPEDE